MNICSKNCFSFVQIKNHFANFAMRANGRTCWFLKIDPLKIYLIDSIVFMFETCKKRAKSLHPTVHCVYSTAGDIKEQTWYESISRHSSTRLQQECPPLARPSGLLRWNTSQKTAAPRNERSWTIIALRTLIFYFWSNIELTWHACSFVPQITN